MAYFCFGVKVASHGAKTLPKGPQGQKPEKVAQFLRAYERRPAKGHMACDRNYDRDLEQKISRIKPEDLDRLMREDD